MHSIPSLVLDINTHGNSPEVEARKKKKKNIHVIIVHAGTTTLLKEITGNHLRSKNNTSNSHSNSRVTFYVLCLKGLRVIVI